MDAMFAILLADETGHGMDGTATVAVLAAAAAIITALATAAVTVYGKWHTVRQERDATALDEYRKYCERMEKQIDRLEKHLAAQQETIDEMHDEHARCQVEMSELWGWAVLIHTVACQLSERLARHSGEQVEVPDLPERPSATDAGFRARTSGQGSRTLQAIDDKLKAINPSNPTPPPSEG